MQDLQSLQSLQNPRQEEEGGVWVGTPTHCSTELSLPGPVARRATASDAYVRQILDEQLK